MRMPDGRWVFQQGFLRVETAKLVGTLLATGAMATAFLWKSTREVLCSRDFYGFPLRPERRSLGGFRGIVGRRAGALAAIAWPVSSTLPGA